MGHEYPVCADAGVTIGPLSQIELRHKMMIPSDLRHLIVLSQLISASEITGQDYIERIDVSGHEKSDASRHKLPGHSHFFVRRNRIIPTQHHSDTPNIPTSSLRQTFGAGKMLSSGDCFRRGHNGR
jgi:hypothetical protein